MIYTIAQAVHDELRRQRANVLNGATTSVPPLRIETTCAEFFDIFDKKPIIIHPVGKGGASYYNVAHREIYVWDYENFVNNLDTVLQKGQRRPDFIVADSGSKIFIINELSTGNPKSKKSDALLQMNHLVQLLQKTSVWKQISAIADRQCIFSCRQSFASTPVVKGDKGIADSFATILSLLPPAQPLNFQPITKAGFRLYQSDHIQF